MLLNKNLSRLFRHDVLTIRTIFTGNNEMAKKLKWAELRRMKWGNDYCMENFDENYKPLYGNAYPSIRLALLSQQKYCAFINNFADIEQAESVMKSIGARNIRHGYNRRLKYMVKMMRKNNPGLLSIDIPLEIEDNSADGEETDDGLISDEVDEDEGRFASLATHTSVNFNEFVPATKLKGLDDYLDESDFAPQSSYDGNFNFIKTKDKPAILPEQWRIYAFKSGNISTYPPPRTTGENVLGYYLMDMASLLPVLALNPRSGDEIFDMCAAPGGKSLAILQTLNDVNITCNDASLSRMKRLQNVFQSFIPSVNDKSKLIVCDGKKVVEHSGLYNKILVDAPCTTDRLSATVDENNIFKPIRMKERMGIPQLQTELLSAALQAVTRGGTVVYSTCSLSPIQNDGVVHTALQELWAKSSDNFVVHDLSDLFYPLRDMFLFHPSPKYGQLVIPNVIRNFGPTYICKISKV